MKFTGMMLLVAALCGCSAPEVVCGRLTDALKGCGFPVTDLSCEGIAYADAEALVARFGERDCAAFSSGDRSVDPRICALGNWPCPLSPTPDANGQHPRYPVVLVSGIDGTPAFDWNPSIASELNRAGIETHHVSVLPWATTVERAKDLQLSLKSLLAHLHTQKVNLVCYAVGGIDCRYLVSPAGLNDSAGVASVTTIATPHRGTRVAEAAQSALQNGNANDVLQALVGSGSTVTLPSDAALLATLDGLGLPALEELNRKLIDAPGVRYLSWAGVSHLSGQSSAATELKIREFCAAPDGTFLFQRHPDTHDRLFPLLWATVPFSFDIHDDAGRTLQSPSDGMVSVASAKWGEFQGCVPADHYDVIGELGHSTRDPATGFDAPLFYRFVAESLAGKGL